MSKRDDMENNVKVRNGLAAGGLATIAALIIKGIAGSNNIRRELEQINAEISDIDRQIDEYKSGLLGSWLNSDEINALKERRRALIARRNELMR